LEIKNFKEMLSTLNAEGAEYLVVGAYANMYYAGPCKTMDLIDMARLMDEG
jgi:hypothetical protein